MTTALFEQASNVESAGGKLDCLSALIGRLAEDGEGETTLLLFALLYYVETVRDDLKEAQAALYKMAREESGPQPPASVTRSRRRKAPS